MAPSANKKNMETITTSPSSNNTSLASSPPKKKTPQSSTTENDSPLRSSTAAHRLDKFGFIVNMNAHGKVVDDDDDDDNHTANGRQRAKDVPTFQEYKKTQRREKKWGHMMGRWHVPEPKELMQKVVTPITATAAAATAGLSPKKKLQSSSASHTPQRGSPRKNSSNGLVVSTSASSDFNLSRSLSVSGKTNGSTASTRQQRIHRRKVITRLRKGVPDHMRGQVWQYLCRVPQRIKQNPGLYQALVQKAILQHEQAASAAAAAQNRFSGKNGQEAEFAEVTSSSIEPLPPADPPTSPYIAKHGKSFKNIQDTIERDIHRTYPRHHLFYESEPSGDADDDESSNTTTGHLNVDDDDDDGDLGETAPEKPRKSASRLSSGSGPPDMPHRPASSLMDHDEEDVEDDGEDEENDDPLLLLQPRSGAPPDLGFCGNEEISNMIRELEGVVAGENNDNSDTQQQPPQENQQYPTPKALISSTSSTTNSTPVTTTTPSNNSAPAKERKNSNGGTNTMPGGSSLVRHLPSRRVVDAAGGQASLRRVLKAYSVFDREVGYCQGMNFVAGLFLTMMPEEESFWMLVSVMNDSPMRMRGLYGEGMKETHLVLHVAEQLIAHYLPSIHAQLERENVHITMFATQWLLTQYTSSFRFDLVTRVWDAFLGEGWKMTYRVMLALLKMHEDRILQGAFEDILTLFRDLPDELDSASAVKVMEVALAIPLQRKTIQKFEVEYWQQQEAVANGGNTNNGNRRSGRKRGKQNGLRSQQQRR